MRVARQVGTGTAAELARLARRFTAWRETRRLGTRIPQPLWEGAVELARRYGVSRTAQAAKVGYYDLMRRVRESAPTRKARRAPTARATFVELPAPLQADPVECVVEFEKAGGSRLRIQLKGPGLPDLAALGRSFWESA